MPTSFRARWLAGVVVAFSALVPGCTRSGPTSPSGGTVGLAVTSIVPTSGTVAGGTPVSIGGWGFQQGATVSINGEATSVEVVNARVLTAVTPGGPAAKVDVVVTNPDGSRGSLRQGYTYVMLPPPSITSVNETVASTAGGAAIMIKGVGFQPGVAVAFGSVPAAAPFLFRDVIYIGTPPHDSGTVDLVVTNTDGRSASLGGGFTFVPPGALDFNGDWDGGAGGEGEVPFRFTIRNNQVIGLACGGVAYTPATHPLTLPLPPAVTGGEFSLSSDEGRVTGRILSPSQATGTIDVPVCAPTPLEWYVTKQ